MNRFLFLPALLLGAFFIPVDSSGQFQGCIDVPDTVILEFKAGMESSVGYYVSTVNCNYTYGVDFPYWTQDSINAYGVLESTSSEIVFTPVNFVTTDSIGLEKVTEIQVSADGEEDVITRQLKLINVNDPNTLGFYCDVGCDSLEVSGIEIYEDQAYSFIYNLGNFGLFDSDYSNNLGLLSIDFEGSESASMFSSNHEDGLKLVFTPEENLNGTITQNFTIIAPDGEILPGLFAIDITPVADITWGNSNEAIFEEGGIDSTDLNNFINVDDSGAELNWAIAESSQLSDSLGPLISINPSTGQLTFDGTNSDYCGTESLDIVVWDVNDSTNSASTGTVSIQVNCVNDAPVVVERPVFRTNADSTGIDAPCEGDTLVLTLEVLEAWIQDAKDDGFNGNGVNAGIDWGQTTSDWPGEVAWNQDDSTLHIAIPDTTTDTSAENASFDVAFSFQDLNGAAVTDTIELIVLPVNDAPIPELVEVQEIFDGDTVSVQIPWSDADDSAVQFQLDSLSEDLIMIQDTVSGMLQAFHPDSLFVEFRADSLTCGRHVVYYHLENPPELQTTDYTYDLGCLPESWIADSIVFNVSLADADVDGIPDHYPGEIVGSNGQQGGDSDGDGIPDKVENNWGESSELGCNYSFVNTDGDEIPDWLDLDSDDDGIPDQVEGGDDLDEDDIPNFRDTDSDGDGILDTLEWSSAEGSINNSDDDENPDFLDVDSDNDLLYDNVEDVNLNGSWDFPESNARLADSDGDGQNDNVEDQTLNLPWGTAYPRIDLDSDDDGLSDSYEREGGLNPYWPDTDFDFLWDGLELGISQDSALSQDGVIQGTATDIGDGFENSDREDYTCPGSSNIRYSDGQDHNATSPSYSDSDNDGIIDGYEDANHNGKFDGVNAPESVIDGATPCANCYADCPDCDTPYPNAAESDPTDDCSPNCLVRESCDCDGTADDADTTQSNFCDDLWIELCQIQDATDLNDVIWELLMPNSNCDRMVRNKFITMPANARNIFTKTNSTSDNGFSGIPANEDEDDYPYACDNCNPGYHLAYNLQGEEYIPCAACSYVGGGFTNDSNDEGNDADGISEACDDCPNDTGGVKGCTDYQAINYNPFAACEANDDCIYTLPDDFELQTVNVCASIGSVDLLEELGIRGQDLSDVVPNFVWGRNGQTISVSYTTTENETNSIDLISGQTISPSFSISQVLANNNQASCGDFEMTLKITHPIESEWFAFKDTAVTFHEYLLKDEYTEHYFNDRGIYGDGVEGTQDDGFYKELTFTLHVDPEPQPNDSSTSLCAGYDDDIQLFIPFDNADGCGSEPYYVWNDLSALEGANTAQPTINLGELVADTTFSVSVTVGECSASRAYEIAVLDSSSIDIQPTTLDFNPGVNSENVEVQFCSNRTDSYDFTIATSGGDDDAPSPLPVGLSVEEDIYSISFADISNSEASTFEFNLDPYNNCPAQTTSITFNPRTAPTAFWDNLVENEICASSNDSVFGYTVDAHDSQQQNILFSQSNPYSTGTIDWDSVYYALNFDELIYNTTSHIADVDLTLTIAAEDDYDSEYGFGCLAVSDTLSIQVAQAAAIEMTSGGSEFASDTIQVCENTPAATYDFGVYVTGGEWDGEFSITEEAVAAVQVQDSYSISVDSLFANNPLAQIVCEVKATTALNNCPSDTARIVFERRTAPNVSWLDADSLILCETAPNDIVIFSHEVGSTSGLVMNWSSTESTDFNFISEGSDLSSNGSTERQLNISDQSFGGNHVIRDTLVTTIAAENTPYGCAAVYDTLVVVVHEAPRIPTQPWNADFFGEPWCTPYSAVVTASLTHDAPDDLWDPDISVEPSGLNGCQWFAGDSLVADTITPGDTEVSIALEWNNNEENGTRKCASLDTTLSVKIGNSPVIDSLNFGLFPEATSTLGLFDTLDYCAGGDPLSFLLWPEALDDPQSSNDSATVQYNWTYNSTSDIPGGDSIFLNWSPPNNLGSLSGQAQWTYNLDGTDWTCSADTTIYLNDLLNDGTACSGMDIVELPYYSYAAQANSNGVEGPAHVQWGYFYFNDDTLLSAQYFNNDPTVVNGVFYPSNEEWQELGVNINDLENTDVVSRLFAVVSFYEDESCPCLSLGNATIVGVDEQWIIDQLGFRVYPNPTTGGVFVEGPRGDFGPQVFAEFYDYTGKRVHRERMESPAREYFDLSHLRNGMYILRIVSPTDVLHTSTLVLTQY